MSPSLKIKNMRWAELGRFKKAPISWGSCLQSSHAKDVCLPSRLQEWQHLIKCASQDSEYRECLKWPDSCIVTCKGCMHIVAVTGYLMYTVIFVLCGRAKLLYTTVVLLGKIVYFKTEKYLQECLLQNRNYRLSAWLACVCGPIKLKFICL